MRAIILIACLVGSAAAQQVRSTATHSPVSSLQSAPISDLTEPGPNGPLPIIGPNGLTPSQAYARPFTARRGRPALAIVIGGLGLNAHATAQAIDELPPEITLSFVPYAPNLQSLIDRARARGHEVMLELPMESFDSVADDTGPQTLLASAPAAQNVSRLEQLLSRGSGYFGVTNYQGARFATSAQGSAPIAQALRRRGLVFISSGIGQRTALSVEATRAQLPTTAADRIIDARREADAIDDQLLNLEALALENQTAIGAGFAYPVTMEQVGRWARDVESRGYQLAPASAVLNARTGPAGRVPNSGRVVVASSGDDERAVASASATGPSVDAAPALAAEVEAGARTLAAQTEITPEFLAELQAFSVDAESLSALLRQLGVEQDLPSIFHDIAEEALERAVELQSADTSEEREAAFTNLRVLLDDAMLIAPMAAAAAGRGR